MATKNFDVKDWFENAPTEYHEVKLSNRTVPSDVDYSEYCEEKMERINGLLRGMSAYELWMRLNDLECGDACGDVLLLHLADTIDSFPIYYKEGELVSEQPMNKDADKDNLSETFKKIKEVEAEIAAHAEKCKNSDWVKGCEKFARDSYEAITKKLNEVKEKEMKPRKEAFLAGMRAYREEMKKN